MRTRRLLADASPAALTLTGWPSGIVHLAVRFEPYQTDQPEAVTNKYGPNGERLGGAHVVNTSDSRSSEVLEDVNLT